MRKISEKLYVSCVDKQGRITVPKAFRDVYDLRPGPIGIDFDEKRGEIIFRQQSHARRSKRERKK
jgi:bifunctional DNA-binding transcriptional regulator/antitoxin component of YhaV-PrlF toxin-antitoxin module